jgi:hypothetical protein
LSGNENHATLINGVGYSSDNRGSLVFDGINDSANVDIETLLVKDFTLDFWVKSAANERGSGMIAYGGNNYAFIAAHTLEENSSKFYFGTEERTASKTLDTNIADNEWHHIVQTYDGTNARVYVDGILRIDDNTTFSGNLRDTSNKTVTIGRWSAANYQDMNISSVKLYNRALSNTEVQEAFDSIRGRYDI